MSRENHFHDSVGSQDGTALKWRMIETLEEEVRSRAKVTGSATPGIERVAKVLMAFYGFYLTVSIWRLQVFLGLTVRGYG